MDCLQELVKALKEHNMDKEYDSIIQVLALSKAEMESISDGVDKAMHNLIDKQEYDKLQNLTQIQQLVSSYSAYLEQLIPNQDTPINPPDTTPAKPKEFFSFTIVNIPVGSEITFIEDRSIKALVNGTKTVAFENKTWTLSQLVRELKKRNNTNTASGAYQGANYFEFNGEKLIDIWQKMRGE